MGDPPFADWGRMATTLKVLVLALAFAAIATTAGVTVGIDNADLKEAMAEAEDTDSALEWTRKHLRNWGGDYKDPQAHAAARTEGCWHQPRWGTGSYGTHCVRLPHGIEQGASDSCQGRESSRCCQAGCARGTDCIVCCAPCPTRGSRRRVDT